MFVSQTLTTKEKKMIFSYLIIHEKQKKSQI